MLVYRFRGPLEPEHTLDILTHKRLYCSSWRDLNDPMEGTYSALRVEDERQRVAVRKQILAEKLRLRVCSLTHTYKTHTMWAYYADAFRGVAIELDIPNEDLKEVNYASGERIQTWANGGNAYELAVDILTQKHRDWEGEQEYRILHNEAFYQLRPHAIRSVILGSRIQPEFETAIRRVAGVVPVRELKIRSGKLWAAPSQTPTVRSKR